MKIAENSRWPIWKKIIFRFFFIYLFLEMAPITWLDAIPGINSVTQYYGKLTDWLVIQANAVLFHVRPVLIPENGSGDTSMGWARLWTYLCIAAIVALIWSVLDKKRPNYTRLNYWLCLFARYYIILVALSYGIIKLFGLQMVFPDLHEMATPVGDLLPMRLSWFFIGYSRTYQFFSGAMEVLAALLLLYRRTISLGVLVATGVFLNVMMLNLSYDIPVKIFSMQMEFTCLFLLVNESERLINFFILNKPAPEGKIYHFNYTKKWMRISRVLFKWIIVAVGLIFPFYQSFTQSIPSISKTEPVKNGVYAFVQYRLNNKDIPLSTLDTLRWKDLIFENGLGSIGTNDTLFRHRYNRPYFSYELDSTKNLVGFKKFSNMKEYFLEFKYSIPDSTTIMLDGLRGKDSLHVELKQTPRHFQLAERQFHWLTEHTK
jgi:hypothetical protein